MSTLFRMVATSTFALWTAAAGAGSSDPGTPPAPQPSQPTGSAPATPPGPQAPSAPAQSQGTPALVLDVKDYEGLLGKGVRAMNGDDLGRIVDMIVDKEGRPRAAIIDFGGFLGVGSRKIAVDWRVLKFVTPDGKPGPITLMLSRNQVRVSPEYKSGEPIVVLGSSSPGGPPVEGDQANAPAAAPAPTPAPVEKPVEKQPEKNPEQ